MNTKHNLSRFLEAQKGDYKKAFIEVQQGKKVSHWMWYIFPQIAGLGFSDTSKYYAIKNLSEAQEYLHHEVLGSRLIAISTELLKLPTSDPIQIFGPIDSLKLRSSMTLFARLNETNPVFQKVLEKFYDGKEDEKTKDLIKSCDNRYGQTLT